MAEKMPVFDESGNQVGDFTPNTSVGDSLAMGIAGIGAAIFMAGIAQVFEFFSENLAKKTLSKELGRLFIGCLKVAVSFLLVMLMLSVLAQLAGTV